MLNLSLLLATTIHFHKFISTLLCGFVKALSFANVYSSCACVATRPQLKSIYECYVSVKLITARRSNRQALVLLGRGTFGGLNTTRLFASPVGKFMTHALELRPSCFKSVH
jgi:hypothetical protein